MIGRNAGGSMTAGPIDYLELTREGLRSVMAKSLAYTIEHGLVDEQHFYITFLTTHSGVVMPDWLKAQFPEEITIVLQYEFRDLAVMSDRFSVSLSFNGRSAILVVPFAAVKTFMDPSVNFQIDIPMPEPDAASAAETEEPGFAMDTATKGLPAPTDRKPVASEDEGDRVVSLDAFRKK
jgi:hypothetical protein